MQKYATIQIKTLTPRQAINRVNENLRLGAKYYNPKIVVHEDNRISTSFSPEKKERSNDDKEIGRKINALRSSIKTYEKRISQCDDEKKKIKMQNKVTDYLAEIRELESKKSGNETRGRKKEKHFVEFIFSLTNTVPNNSNLNNRFSLAQSKYLHYFKDLELVSNVTHLDQHSVHSHAIFKIPKGQTWTQCWLDKAKVAKLIEKNSSKKLYDALKSSYETIARHFQNFMSKELGIRFDSLKKGIFYTSLSKYKKQTGFGNLNNLETQKSESSYDELGTRIKRLNAILEKSKQISLNDEEPTKYQINKVPDETNENDDTQYKKKTQKPR